MSAKSRKRIFRHFDVVKIEKAVDTVETLKGRCMKDAYRVLGQDCNLFFKFTSNLDPDKYFETRWPGEYIKVTVTGTVTLKVNC